MGQAMILPEKEADLIDTIKQVVTAGEAFRNKEKVKWLFLMLYLQGVRNFSALDWARGTIQVEYQNMPFSNDDFRYEGLLQYYQTELGRMMSIDLSPHVSRRGQGLDGLRWASVGQVVLDDRMGVDRAALLKQAVLPIFLKYGHLGIGAFADGKNPRLEIVPGWEILSVPADPVIPTEVDALIRDRWVRVEWLEKVGLITKGDRDGNYRFQTTPMSTTPGGSFPYDPLSATPPFGVGRTAGTDKPGEQNWGRFIEVWTRNSDNYLEEYVATVGEKQVARTDYKDQGAPMPLNIARYIDTGGFYGRGFISQFIDLNNEVEYMLNQLFRNVENFDLFGYLCLSTQMGLNKADVQEARSTDKILMYQPDVWTEQAPAPFLLQPSNSGKAPLGIVQLGIELMQGQSSQSELFQGDAPGRVDSAKGLGFLYETANIPLSGPMESLSTALSHSYRALLWLTKALWDDEKVLSLTLTDDSLVGIRYDADRGEVTLERNSIPDPEEVVIEIASKVPMSPMQQKSDLERQLELGAITMREYRFKVREKGLDVPVGSEAEWQNYRRAKLENIQLYGDGENAGSISIAENDIHEIHLDVLRAFMARPEYHQASDEVKSFFREHEKGHVEGMGTYPEGLPYPGTEDEALMAATPEGQAMMEGAGAPPEAAMQL